MPVWFLEKEFRFEAAHMLPHHDGKCRRLHGHSWRMTVRIDGTSLEDGGAKVGMLFDYGDISSIVNPIVRDYLDHYYLNETLDLENPTSEEIARWAFEKLNPILPNLHSITIEETCTARCTYVAA